MQGWKLRAWGAEVTTGRQGSWGICTGPRGAHHPGGQGGQGAMACEPAQRNAGVWTAGKGGERASSAEELTDAGKGRMQGAGIWRKTWDPISQVPKVSSWGSV